MKNIVVACYFKGEQYLTFSAMKKGLEGSCNNYVIIRADIMSGMSSSQKTLAFSEGCTDTPHRSMFANQLA